MPSALFLPPLWAMLPRPPHNPQAGQAYRGRVVRLLDFGAMLELEGLGLRALLHISEVAPTRIRAIDDVLKVGRDGRDGWLGGCRRCLGRGWEASAPGRGWRACQCTSQSSTQTDQQTAHPPLHSPPTVPHRWARTWMCCAWARTRAATCG